MSAPGLRSMRDEELGPLHGLPLSIKDLVVTKDVRTTHASRLYAANMAAFILAMCRDGVLLSGPEEIDSDEIAAACCVLVKGEFR